MKLKKEMKQDKKIEKYFLNALKWILLLDEYPESFPLNASQTEIEKYNALEEKHDSAMAELYFQLQIDYELVIRKADESDPAYSLMNEMLEYYIRKYGKEKIMRMEIKTTEERIVERTVMEQILLEGSNKCVTCKGPRTEMNFEQLPEATQKIFEDKLSSDIDYFLYCPHCEKYSMSYKMESFGFDE